MDEDEDEVIENACNDGLDCADSEEFSTKDTAGQLLLTFLSSLCLGYTFSVRLGDWF